VRATSDSLSVGERTELQVLVLHDGARTAIFPDELGSEPPPETIGVAGDFELLRRISTGFRLLEDGSRLDSVIYEATTFALDTAYAAPVVGLTTESDTLISAAPPSMVFVRSVVPPEAEDVLDIAPIAEFPRTWWPWLLLVALVIAGLIAWRWYRRAHPEPPEEVMIPAEPEEPAIAEAIRRLAALEDVRFDGDEAMKPYFVELSDILRTYLARRTGAHALEMTSGELVAALRYAITHRTIAGERIEEVERLLRAADLVKFADYHPDPENARAAVARTRHTIEHAERDFRVYDVVDDSAIREEELSTGNPTGYRNDV
jgi:hypothetical protein